ncbi:MAG: YbhB/YbcL family Raf kinase inhibitor-like protein [Deltaproteobacteria bacterium]|nr:YbhB/YbcL family Raf kinase inhibitor-like protein [Deltaproteobacteria bacterium]
MRSALFVGVVALAACGDDGGSPGTTDASTDGAIVDATSDAPIDARAAAFTLTSPTITEGGVIPLTHVCTARGGMNLSPQLAWTNAPATAMSFAVVFTDVFNPAQPFVHSVVYDIPATLSGLPADVDKVYAPPDVPGAHQTLGYNNTTRGYLGPCPNAMHTYELALYALPTATLPGSTIGTTRDAAITAITANDLAVTKLTATFTP